jgi:aldehyde dehydrogenase (NAD+)
VIEANLEDVVSLEAADSGKPYQWSKLDTANSRFCLFRPMYQAKADSRNVGIAAIRYYAGLAGKISGSTVDVGETSKQVVVRREPIGVVAQITPWNFPIMMAGSAALATYSPLKSQS